MDKKIIQKAGRILESELCHFERSLAKKEIR